MENSSSDLTQFRNFIYMLNYIKLFYLIILLKLKGEKLRLTSMSI